MEMKEVTPKGGVCVQRPHPWIHQCNGCLREILVQKILTELESISFLSVQTEKV